MSTDADDVRRFYYRFKTSVVQSLSGDSPMAVHYRSIQKAHADYDANLRVGLCGDGTVAPRLKVRG